MGKGNYVLHTIKLKSKDLRGLCNHNERKTENSSNPDIQRCLTSSNYELHRGADENTDYEKDVKALISERYDGRKLRENITFAVSFNISSGKEFFDGMSQEREREFFQANYDLVAEKYGKENIISARVHKDEETPHMHLVLVPFTKDNRLSAKELFDRGNLRELQDFALRLQEKGFDIERGKDAEGKNKHLETRLFKEIEKIHEVALIENIAFDKQNEIGPLKQKLIEFEKTKEEFSKVEKPMIDLYSFKEQSYERELGGLLKKPTGNYIVPQNELIELRTLAQQGILLRDENKKLEKTNNFLERRNEELNKQIIDYPKLERENRNLILAFEKTMMNYQFENSGDNKKPKEFFEKSLKSALYTMTKEEKISFCNKINKSEIIRSDLKQSIQKVYDISTGKIKENSKGFERWFKIKSKDSKCVLK